jgi:hypothetical protein
LSRVAVILHLRRQTAAAARFSAKMSQYPIDRRPQGSECKQIEHEQREQRALSSDLCGCPLRSPATCFCPAIRAVTVSPRATWALAASTASRSIWIAASHNAPSSGGNSRHGPARQRNTSSTCDCRKNAPGTTVGKAAFLDLEVGLCIVTNAASAASPVAMLGKSVPSWPSCVFYVTSRGHSSRFVTMFRWCRRCVQGIARVS